MKIGILADIHEHVANLRVALRVFQDQRVDQIVLLGDVIETGEYIDETVKLSRDVNAVGVWGNHDLGLSHEPEPRVLERFSPPVVGFFARLSSRYEIDKFLFTHAAPTWDPTDPEMFYLGPMPWETDSLQQTLSTFEHSLFFVGHFHRWYSATPEGDVFWDVTTPIILDAANRYFTVVHAVMNGWCATLDTESREFAPSLFG